MSRQNSRKYLLLIGFIAIGALLAGAAGVHLPGSAQEVHGKLPVKLTEKFTLRFPTGTTGVQWSPDGSTLAVTSNYSMKFDTYDRSGKPLHSFEANGNIGAYLNNFAFIKDASQVLFSIENIINPDAALDIRDVATGHILQTLTRTSTKVRALYFAVSPNQKRFAIANPVGKEVVTYSSDNGNDWKELSIAREHIAYADHNKQFWHAVNCLSFFPDNRLVAVGKLGGYFSVVDSTTGEILNEFNPYIVPGNIYTPQIYSIDVSPHGDMLLAGVGGGGIRDGSGTVGVFDGVSIWRVKDGTPVTYLDAPNEMIRENAWDSKGRFVAFIGSKSLFIWQPDKSNQNYLKIGYPDLTASLALSRDGKYLAVAEGAKVIVYNVEDN